MNFDTFLGWEAKTDDTLDFKRIYVDIAGDLIAGLALSHIVYWYLPSKKNKDSKLRVKRDGHYWIASTRYEWWERARITPKQIDRALKILQKKQLIEKRTMMFSGEPTTHIRLLTETFLRLLSNLLDHPAQNPFLPKGEELNAQNGNSPVAYRELINSLQEGTPYTENTASNTSIEINIGSPASGGTAEDNFTSSDSQYGRYKNDAVDQAIGEEWNTKSPGKIEKIKKTLLGLHEPNSEDYSCNVQPPATPDEIHQMGELFKRKFPAAYMPLVPFKIQDWLYQSREKIWIYYTHNNYCFLLDVQVPRDLEDTSQILSFLKRYHPKEYIRVQSIMNRIDTTLEPTTEHMILDPITYYKDYEIVIPIIIPFKDKEALAEIDDWLDYLSDFSVSAYAFLKNEKAKIDNEMGVAA